jgi:hypothetical protein
MMESKELEAHVFHCLRIIGNALLVIHFLDQVTVSVFSFCIILDFSQGCVRPDS